MVRLDGRKLTAPLLAQSVAFVAILVIGGLTSHKSASHQTHTSHISGSGNGSPHSTGLTVEVFLVGATRGAGPTVPVEIIQEPAVTVVVSANLAVSVTGTELMHSVPVGDYLVCVNPSHVWTVTGPGVGALLGWDCIKVDARSRAQKVTFDLTRQPTNAGTVPF